jgi:hypothetical protein
MVFFALVLAGVDGEEAVGAFEEGVDEEGVVAVGFFPGVCPEGGGGGVQGEDDGSEAGGGLVSLLDWGAVAYHFPELVGGTHVSGVAFCKYDLDVGGLFGSEVGLFGLGVDGHHVGVDGDLRLPDFQHLVPDIIVVLPFYQ